MRKRRRPSFEERLFFTVRNFVEYGTYGGDRARALKRLRSHHPERGAGECEDCFALYVRAYEDAVFFVERNAGYYWSVTKIESESHSEEWPYRPSEAEKEFIIAHPGVPPEILVAMVWFIFDWRHRR